jgi:glycosyltransferase 2 family protein
LRFRPAGALRTVKVALKWAVSLAIGAFFIWLSARSWPLDKVFAFDFHMEGTTLVAGDLPPSALQWDPPAAPAASPAGPPELRSAVPSSAHPKAGWYFDLTYILWYGLVLVVIHFLRVVRWDPLLRPIAKVGFWKLNRVGAVGNMAVFLFPLRLGEFVRPYLIAEPGRIRMSEGMATIAVERVIDGLMTSLLLFIVLQFLPTDNATSFADLRAGSYIALFVFLASMAVLTLMYWRRDFTVRLIRRFVGRVLPGIAERIIGVLEAFLRGLSVLPDWRNLAAFVGITTVYWIVNGFGLWLFARGFGLHVPAIAAYAMMASVVVGMMIPNSPANVGSFWFFLLKPIELYGLGAGDVQATACALGIWGMQLLQLLIFGGWFLVLGKVSVKSVWQMTTGRHEEKDPAERPSAEVA